MKTGVQHNQSGDSVAVDSAAVDSVAIDTAHHDTTYVLVVEPMTRPELSRHDAGASRQDGVSWIIASFLLLFVVVAIRFRNNSKYLGALLRSAIEVRERGNVFDDTVKETSFMIILNIFWGLCAGMMLYMLVGGRPDSPGAAAGMGIGIGLALAYEILIILAYWMVGNVFSDSLHTRMWVRGYLSATGLTTLVLFPVVLMAVCYPGQASIFLWIGLIAFIIGKIVFIWKGFRIFFNEISAWVLFLYYLCSLEIVPLILLYVAAAALCR